MSVALHVIAKAQGAQRRGLERLKDREKLTYKSGCWVQLGVAPEHFTGGYIYLHETSNAGAAIGGKIIEVVSCDRTEYGGDPAIRYGTAFVFEPLISCRNIAWRGNRYGAHSGIVDTDLPHET